MHAQLQTLSRFSTLSSKDGVLSILQVFTRMRQEDPERVNRLDALCSRTYFDVKCAPFLPAQLACAPSPILCYLVQRLMLLAESAAFFFSQGPFLTPPHDWYVIHVRTSIIVLRRGMLQGGVWGGAKGQAASTNRTRAVRGGVHGAAVSPHGPHWPGPQVVRGFERAWKRFWKGPGCFSISRYGYDPGMHFCCLPNFGLHKGVLGGNSNIQSYMIAAPIVKHTQTSASACLQAAEPGAVAAWHGLRPVPWHSSRAA